MGCTGSSTIPQSSVLKLYRRQSSQDKQLLRLLSHIINDIRDRSKANDITIQKICIDLCNILSILRDENCPTICPAVLFQLQVIEAELRVHKSLLLINPLIETFVEEVSSLVLLHSSEGKKASLMKEEKAGTCSSNRARKSALENGNNNILQSDSSVRLPTLSFSSKSSGSPTFSADCKLKSFYASKDSNSCDTLSDFGFFDFE